MPQKKVVIIGAGLSGLAAGIFLASEGVETVIFESAPWPGGLCRSWTRRDYRFDGCIQWMSGFKPDDPAYRLYREVGALDGNTGVFKPGTASVEVDGAVFDVPMEHAAFREFLCALSAEDTDRINALCGDVETMMRAGVLPGVTGGLRGTLACLRAGCWMLRLRSADKTVAEVAAGFKSTQVSKILTRLIPGAYSAFAFYGLLGARLAGNAGYPLGGAAGMIDRMTAVYASLGGTLYLGTRAEEIVVTGGEARGIIAGGVFCRADGVIAACDTHETLHNLLRGRFEHQQLTRLFNEAPLFEPLCAVSFGLCRPFGIPYALTCECPEGLNVAPGVRRYGFLLRSFDFDPTAAPPGHSSVMAMFETPLGYWKMLRATDSASYKVQKELLADHVASRIDRRYPGFRDAVEISDVATPATYVRLTSVFRGSYEGFAPTPATLKAPIRKTLPGLKRFCLCGQWTAPGGGIAAAVAGGKEAARLMQNAIGRTAPARHRQAEKNRLLPANLF